MAYYAGIVMVLNFAVELLLLLGTDRLCGYFTQWGRTVLAAGAGGLYAGACLVSQFSFMSSAVWHIFSLLLMVALAYGVSLSAARRGAVFLLLNMALEGVACGFSAESLWHLLLGAVLILLMCVVGFYRGQGVQRLPVEIAHEGKLVHLTALRDTGNTLLDPVTGKPVLIISADAAYQLTGLTQGQLRTPLDTMVSSTVPGLRLIPYHTIGQNTGFLLAMRMQNIKIANKERSCLVAFAPEGLGREGTYQALTGGII